MEEGLSVHFSEKFLKFPFEFDLYLWVWFTILVKPALKIIRCCLNLSDWDIPAYLTALGNWQIWPFPENAVESIFALGASFYHQPTLLDYPVSKSTCSRAKYWSMSLFFGSGAPQVGLCVVQYMSNLCKKGSKDIFFCAFARFIHSCDLI